MGDAAAAAAVEAVKDNDIHAEAEESVAFLPRTQCGSRAPRAAPV